MNGRQQTAAVFAAVLALTGQTISAQSIGDKARAALYGKDPALKTAVIAIRNLPTTGRTIVVMTARDPADPSQTGTCHACSPQIGVAVFRKLQRQWVLALATKLVDRIGVWGAAPTNIHLVDLGADEGILLRQTEAHGGGIASWGTLLLIERNQVWEVGTMDFGEDTTANCDPHAEPDDASAACIRYTCKLRLVPRKDELSDLALEKIGTAWDDKSKRLRSVHQLITYRYNGTRYDQIGSRTVH